MSFSAFYRNRFPRNDLRQRLYEEREFALLGAPRCGGGGCGNDTVCMISRPLCDDYDFGFSGCVGYGGGRCTDRGFGRGSGGWQRIGYLLPLYVEPRAPKVCNCSKGHRGGHGHSNTPTWSRQRFPLVRQPSQFSGNHVAPYDSYDNDHDSNCALFANDEDCQNRQCGVRRYHLYVRVDPERLGQQCFRTSCRRGDNRYNNCKYLQFGVAEEGLHDSAIMIINSDFIADGVNHRFNHASRCIENGDVLFIPGERNRKFRVHLYDDQIYDGNC